MQTLTAAGLLVLLQLVSVQRASSSGAAVTGGGSSSSGNNNNNNNNAAGTSSKQCLCQASGCLCCVELNLTSSIDLGGPACVNVRQRECNVTLNLSYADNPVHNATIGLDKAARKPTCMNLLSDLAQICAVFVSMKPQQPRSDRECGNYDGCLIVQPALLGAPQATYPVGCFNFNAGTVRKIEGIPMIGAEEDEAKPDDDEEEEYEYVDDNYAEKLLAAVSASAEQGIAIFSQWLAHNFAPTTKLNVTSLINENSNNNNNPETSNNNNNNNEASSGYTGKLEQRPANSASSSSRHGRTITILGESEDKNEERFKQLLSAQDNILKESATIGKPPRGFKTAYLYSEPDATELRAPNNEANAPATISPENLAVVPSESRRGGRAYNIHQHVNEV